MVCVPKLGTKLGDNTPVMVLSNVGFTAAKVPPTGDTATEYAVLLLHIAGIGVIIGGAGLMAVMLKVFVKGQLATEGVTTTVYITLLTVPGATVGEMMVCINAALLPASQTLGVQE